MRGISLFRGVDRVRALARSARRKNGKDPGGRSGIVSRGLVARTRLLVSDRQKRAWRGPTLARWQTGCHGTLRGLARENAGVAAIEFAIYGTVFLLIVAGTVDIGMLLFTQSELDAAVSAGAEYAVNNAALVGSNPSGLNTDISNIVNNANGASWASSTVNINNSNDQTGCYCPTGTPGNWSWGGAVTCGSSCTGGGIAGQFVTITASRSISPMFPTFGFVQNGTISRSGLVETQ